MSKLLPGVFLAFMLLAGCQSGRPLYYWGHYESMIYQSYAKPDKITAEQQIEQLQEDVQKAAAVNLPVHPGLHAHLGYLYYQLGKQDLAQKEFNLEKNLFPESATFIDRVLNQSKPQ